jgi:hypothetical protein
VYSYLYQLVRASVSADDIIVVYCFAIRSILLDYTSPVWYPRLIKVQSDDLNYKRVQRRYLKIILPNLSYGDALSVSGVEKTVCSS